MNSMRLQRIIQEVMLLARENGMVEYDEEDGRWVHLPDFSLPDGWDRATTGMLLVLPDGYPHIPPDGFYVDRFLRTRSGLRLDHYFEDLSQYNPYAAQGWAWFCIHLKNGSWRPAASIEDGDSLFTLTALIRAILTEVVSASPAWEV